MSMCARSPEATNILAMSLTRQHRQFTSMRGN